MHNQPHYSILIFQSNRKKRMLPFNMGFTPQYSSMQPQYPSYSQAVWFPQPDFLLSQILFPNFQSNWPNNLFSMQNQQEQRDLFPPVNPVKSEQLSGKQKNQISAKEFSPKQEMKEPIQGLIEPILSRQEEKVSSSANQGRKNKNMLDKEKRRKTETKNLIKNYGRAMLTFMLKAKNLRKRLLLSLGIRENEFLDVIYEFRDQIHTISAIRYLWQSHPFSKAFRILSYEYLRKHNLQHVFNSRVVKFDIYLRYQNKIRLSIQNPSDFQSIKDF